MADRTTVQIPVEVQLKLSKSADELKSVADEFQRKLESVDPSSVLYKSYEKLFQKVETKFSKIKGLTGKSIFTESDFRRVVKYFEDIEELASTINNKTSNIGGTAFGIDVPGLKEAKQLIKDIQNTIKTEKNKNVSEILPKDELLNFSKNAKKSKFSGGKSYQANIDSMEKAVGELTVEYIQLEAAAEAAGKAETLALEKVAQAEQAKLAVETRLNNKKAALSMAQKNRQDNINTIANQFSMVGGTGGSGDNKRFTKDVLNDYQQIVSNLIKTADEAFTKEGKTFASILGEWLDIEPQELQGEANQIVQTLQKAIAKAATNSKGQLSLKQIKSLVGDFPTKVSSNPFLAEESEIAAIEAELNTKAEELKQATENKDSVINATTEARSNLKAAEDLLKEIKEQLKQLKKLKKEHDKIIDDSHSEQLSEAQRKAKELDYKGSEDYRKISQGFVEQAGKNRQSGEELREEYVLSRQRQNEAAREAENFTNNLKQSVRHWMGAAQVVNIIRNGIRTAISDIKSLDKAMTDIAVVTDMSVSDLWGKISEYMAIAQEYGVTTQGVYEVSQLYYQQGLSTSEVMAATTETLKMARIAGMDYKDAADAMTVAIRAFKMEMSDAQHVTDVYSKVAAVTASDTNELATAMSKTASSAESVGSSFENTTAMLAVMIETTRESAQNLGSALKSIISRYGEMKVGLTVDSEGEEIDYNKVDTALKSVGISIKDAQGQFRDFDEVIFELSEKWDSLDKNTQRYIATIMAGNRQQSRFIALVDNWERLEEVTAAAQDSEDAGLLQYAKTLDSLDTKLNNIKTSFQEFYMSIFNGETFKGILDFINKLIKGLNKIGTFNSIINVASIISGVKLVGTILVNSFSSSFGAIIQGWKNMFHDLVLTARKEGQHASSEFHEGVEEGNNINIKKGYSSKTTALLTVSSLAATGLNILGTSMAESNPTGGAHISALGSGLQIGLMLGQINPLLGVAAGALTTFIGVISNIPSELEKAQQELEKAQKTADEANLAKAQAKEEVSSLETALNNLKRLEKARYSSIEAEQEYQNALNQFADTYPNLINSVNEMGEVTIAASEAEQELALMRANAAKATLEAAVAEANVARTEKKTVQAESEAIMENYKPRIFSVDGSRNYKNLGISIATEMFTGVIDSLGPIAADNDALANSANDYLIKVIKDAKLEEYFDSLIDFSSGESPKIREIENYYDAESLNDPYKISQLDSGMRLLTSYVKNNLPDENVAGFLRSSVSEETLSNELYESYINDQQTLNKNKKQAEDFQEKNKTGFTVSELYNYWTKAQTSGMDFLKDWSYQVGVSKTSKEDLLSEYETWFGNLGESANGNAYALQPIELAALKISDFKEFLLQQLGASIQDLPESLQQLFNEELSAGTLYDQLIFDKAESTQLKNITEQLNQYSLTEDKILGYDADRLFYEEAQKLAAYGIRNTELNKKIARGDRIAAEAQFNQLYEMNPLKDVYNKEWIKDAAFSQIINDNYDQLFDKNGFFKKEFLDKDGKLDTAKISETLQMLYRTAQSSISNNLDSLFYGQSEKIAEFENFYQSALKGEISNLDIMTEFNTRSPYNAETRTFENDFINQLYKDVLEARNLAQNNLLSWLSSNSLKDTTGTIVISDEEGNKKFSEEWQAALDRVPHYYWTAVGSYIENIDKQIKAGTISADDANAYFEQYRNLISLADPKYFADIFSADLSSEMGLLQLAQKMREKGATDKELQDLLGAQIDKETKQITGFTILTYANNVTTSYATLEDSIIAGLEQMRSILDKATQGMNTGEALSMAKTLGKDLTDTLTFEFFDGKWYVKDIQAIQDYTAKIFGEQKNLFTSQLAELEKIDLVASNPEVQTWEEEYKDNQHVINAQKWFESLSDTEKKSLTFRDYSKLENIFLEYKKQTVQDLNNKVEALTKEEQALIDAYTRDIEIATAARARESASGDKNKIESAQLVASKGLSGYTAKEIERIKRDLGIDENDIIDNKDGTYGIQRIALEGIEGISTALMNAILTSIDNTIKGVMNSMSSIGEAAAMGEDYDYSSVFKSEARERLNEKMPSLLRDAALKNLVTSQVTIKAMLYKEGLRGEELQQAYDELINSYLDSAIERNEIIYDTEKQALLQLEALTNGQKEAYERAIRAKYVSEGKSGEDLETAVATAMEELNSTVSLSFAERFNRYVSLLETQAADATSGVTPKDVITRGLDFIEQTLEASQLAATVELDRLKEEVSKAIIEGGGKNLSSQQAAQLAYYMQDMGFGIDPKELFQSDGKGGFDIKSEYKKLVNLMFSDEIAQYTETTLRTQISSVQEFLQSAAANPQEVDTSKVYDLYNKMGIETTWTAAAKIARQITAGGADAALQAAKDAVAAAGIEGDLGESVTSTLERIIDLLFDTINDAISGNFDSLGAGISGTLKAADYAALLDKYNAEDSGYIKLSGQALKTSQGLKLNKNDTLAILQNIRADMEKNGTSSDFAMRAFEVMKENGVEYRDIQEEINALEKQHEEAANETKAELEGQLSVLKEIKQAMEMDPEGSILDFMNQDPFGGMADGFDNFVGSIEQVQGAMEDFASTGSIGYRDFYNMMDFLNNQGQWESFASNIAEASGNAGKSYEEFVNSVMRNTNELGKINIEGVAAEMGISVDAAMDAMKGSMTEGLKQVAQDQIKYLSGLEKMLLAMQALNEVDVSLGITIATSSDEDVLLTLENIYDYWTDIQALPKDLQSDITAEVKIRVDEIDSILDNQFGQGLNWQAIFFGKDGFDLNEADVQMADLLGTYITALQNASQGQAEYLAGGLWDVVTPYLEYNSTTDTYSIKAGEGIGQQLTQAVFDYLKTSNNWSDLESIPSLINSQISEKIAKEGTIEVPYGEGGITLTAGEGGQLKITGLTPEDIETEDTKNSVIAALNEALGTAITDITYNAEAGGWQFYGATQSQEDKKAIEEVNIQFKDAATAAEGLNTAIKGINSGIAAFTYSGAFKKFLEAIISAAVAADKLKGLTDTGPETTTSTPQAIAYGDNGPIFAEETELPPLKVTADVTEAENSLEEFKQGTEETKSEIDIGADTEEAKEKNQELLVLVDNSEANIEVDAETSEAAGAINALTKTETKTINIKYKPNFAPVLMEWTGTMNDISGSAFADGSIGRLYSGAQLANKVLVGELGPELAVYDGQYHMLGANGAEFVHLPKDTIIFNHLQTQGILNGQMNIRGTAMAEGNINGPAYANGITGALAAVRRAKSIWQGLLNTLSATDLLGGSGVGGGGGDNSIKAHYDELQEWYNLSRKIAYIEQEINNLLAERANIQEANGEAYLRSLREQEALLREQIATQDTLLRYQQMQLERQAEHINNNKIWSQFLEVDENGLLQYRDGNELFGKGALSVLDELNKMSGQQQYDFITKKLGYSYTDQDGKELKNEELIAKFYEELQKQIDEYDALYDTVHETESTLEELQSTINEINEEIKQNQMDLEQAIYDIIVEAWEKEIEEMEKQAEVIKEANDAYIQGLNDALLKEKELYGQDQRISDREQLQRQLSLLRRSGGSASEIAILEEQLDDMLKDEYFNNQQKMIEKIQDANKEQVRKLDEQITIQQESLEYQKETGALWTQVYQVLSQDSAAILAFMMGQSPDFFTKSGLTQQQALEEWSKKVGIYTEDRQRQNYQAEAEQNWNSGYVWQDNDFSKLSGYQDVYNNLDSEAQTNLQNLYNSTYTQSMLEGMNSDQAHQAAAAKLQEQLEHWKSQQDVSNRPDQEEGDEGWDTSNYSSVTFSIKANPSEGGKPGLSTYNAKPHIPVYVSPNPNSGWKFVNITVNGKTKTECRVIPSGNVGHIHVVVNYVKEGVLEKAAAVTLTGMTAAQKAAARGIQALLPQYSSGGLVDYTGPALVHGSPSKPEAFLNAKQTAMISEAIKVVGDGGILDGIRATLDKLNSTIKTITNIEGSNASSFTIAPGAVVLNVAKLNNSYDVEDLSNDIMNRMAVIASKASGRGVNRR